VFAGATMRTRSLLLICVVVTTCAGQNVANRQSLAPAPWQDPAPHTVRFVEVEHNVRLEVLDWGGSGRPLVLLAGLGNTAHVFDEFAPKLTAAGHVYGVTRRGFGASSSPAGGCSADRLGDDVLAVVHSLELDRPVLMGHSIAGEELSSVGTRHPEEVAGLIYLDAAYPYAYYDPSVGDLIIDSLYVRRELDQLPAASTTFNGDKQRVEKLLKQAQDASTPRQEMPFVQRLLQTDLPLLEKELRGLVGSSPIAQELLGTSLPSLERELQKRLKDLETRPERSRAVKAPIPGSVDLKSLSALHSWMKRVDGFAPPEAELRQHFAAKADGGIGKERDFAKAAEAVQAGLQKYTNISVPILAIYSVPQRHDTGDSAGQEAQAKAFEAGLPSARVVRIPHADHFVFLSNEAEVLREIQAFLHSLPGPAR